MSFANACADPQVAPNPHTCFAEPSLETEPQPQAAARPGAVAEDGAIVAADAGLGLVVANTSCSFDEDVAKIRRKFIRQSQDLAQRQHQLEKATLEHEQNLLGQQQLQLIPLVSQLQTFGAASGAADLDMNIEQKCCRVAATKEAGAFLRSSCPAGCAATRHFSARALGGKQGTSNFLDHVVLPRVPQFFNEHSRHDQSIFPESRPLCRE